MRSYEAATSVAAGPDEVWAVLSDVAGWSSWESGVTGVEGRLAVGQKVTIRSAAAPGRAFPVTVAALEPARRIVLTGGLPLGLVRGTRTYTLAPEGDGRTSFTVREEFTGPLLGLVWRTMPDLQPSFDQFAAGLRRRVETGA